MNYYGDIKNMRLVYKMGKIYNVQLNSQSGTITGTAYSTVNYNIDWANLLPNKKFKLTFAFMSSLNYGNNFLFPYISTNILGNTYKPATNGYQNAYYLGHLRVIPAPMLNFCYYSSTPIENPTIYLNNRPQNPNLLVQILNNSFNTEYLEPYQTVAGSGTLSQSGFVITILTATAGIISIGTVITVAAVNRTVTNILSGSGGVGVYICDVSAIVAAGTAYTFLADNTPAGMAPYILNLSFEEVDED